MIEKIRYIKKYNESFDSSDIVEDVKNITKWLKEYLKISGAKGFVIGLSGGVDSSAVCGLAVDAAGKENVIGILLPSIVGYKDDVLDGKRVAKHYGIKYIVHPIKETVSTIIKENKDMPTMAIANIQARIRMTLLRMYAELNGYLVIGTTNKSEDMLGYFTKSGDGGSGVDVEPLSQYYKSEIKKFAKYYKLPYDLVNRVPSAGLWANQTDEGELGFTYDDFENYWKWKLSKNGDCPVTEEVVKKIEKLYRTTEHKRNLPPYYKRK